MNFEKIYAEFEAAKAVDDLERMSDIIARVHKVCDALEQAGRADEIPQSAFRIARHVYIMLYHVTKLLRGGDVNKAKSYMLALADNNAANFDTFFYLLYLLGKTFYATGDYSWAEKCFERYEKIRDINFGDVDELTLFYRANCLAQLGDLNAAADLYEKILKIKSDFPEAKKNLGAIRGGATKSVEFFLLAGRADFHKRARPSRRHEKINRLAARRRLPKNFRARQSLDVSAAP